MKLFFYLLLVGGSEQAAGSLIEVIGESRAMSAGMIVEYGSETTRVSAFYDFHLRIVNNWKSAKTAQAC